MAGQFKSTVECLNCKKISICFDPFLLISMPIPNPKVFSVYILLNNLSMGAIKVNI
jgi:ubiquitin C-terminal hydrolase